MRILRGPARIYFPLLIIALIASTWVNSLALAAGLQDNARSHMRIADPIRTDAGYISGTLIGDVGKEVRVYRGIPTPLRR